MTTSQLDRAVEAGDAFRGYGVTQADVAQVRVDPKTVYARRAVGPAPGARPTSVSTVCAKSCGSCRTH